jgi:hypothetical protein
LSEEDDVVDVKTYTKAVREGEFFVRLVGGGTVRSDPEEE